MPYSVVSPFTMSKWILLNVGLLVLLSKRSFTESTNGEDQVLLNQYNQHSFGTHGKVSFRDAVEADLDEMIEVFYDAFSPAPLSQYLLPDQEKWRNYTLECLRRDVHKQWPVYDRSLITLKVITVPLSSSASPNTRPERVVSAAQWNLLDRHKHHDFAGTAFPGPFSGILRAHETGTPVMKSKCSLHLDTNLTRAADYGRQYDRVEKKYIDKAYDHQLYLAILATHPDWDGHGFGAEQVRWGMETAKERDLPLTLIATPAGYPLYHSLGFESLKNASIQLLDNLGHVWFEVMKWPAK